jgi:hypothetical protein
MNGLLNSQRGQLRAESSTGRKPNEPRVETASFQGSFGAADLKDKGRTKGRIGHALERAQECWNCP